jgi:hypothetical protein
MDDNWAAAMTFLERTRPGRWRRRDQIDVRPAMDAAQDQEEQGVLADSDATELMHRALAAAAGQPGLPVVEGTAREVEPDGQDSTG